MAVDPLEPRAFLSYVRDDDAALNGGITWLRERLERTLKAVTGAPFPIFQDESGIQLGEHWPSRLEEALKEARFLIPMLTPSYFNSEACRREAELFLDFEAKAGRDDLVLPIYLIDAEILDEAARRRHDPLARRLHQRQRTDWREIAFGLKEAPDISTRIADLARKIAIADKRDRASLPPLAPDQERGIRFRINEDGLIDRAFDDGLEVADEDVQMLARRDGLLDAADRFLGGFGGGLGDNAAGHLIDAVKSYKEAISGPLSSIQFSDVWRLGSRLQNAADAASRAIARMDLPSLEDEQQAALFDLLAEHGPFIYSTPTGRAEQAKADRFHATQEEQKEIWRQNARFGQAVKSEKSLFSEHARKVVTDVNEQHVRLENPPDSIEEIHSYNVVADDYVHDDDIEVSRHPERALVIAETTNKNLLAMVGKAATGSTVGEGLADLGESTISRAQTFLVRRQSTLQGLVASSKGGLAWLSDLMKWMKERGRDNGDEPSLPSAAPASPTRHHPSRPPGTVFRDIDEPWCPEMVVIPAGSFMMGSPETERERRDNEGPQHLVTIQRSFALGRYPVTFEEFDYFCDQVGQKKPADVGWGRGRRPVIHVSWKVARTYCAWLSEEAGVRYLLPSEAWWEYACRAGTETRYALGDDIGPDQANFGNKTRKTSDVGAYPANDFGLFDMHGNVLEWCEDWYHSSYEGMPDDGAPYLSDGTVRVLRGGSWDRYAQYLRSACRDAGTPGDRNDDLGFRCARVQE